MTEDEVYKKWFPALALALALGSLGVNATSSKSDAAPNTAANTEAINAVKDVEGRISRLEDRFNALSPKVERIDERTAFMYEAMKKREPL